VTYRRDLIVTNLTTLPYISKLLDIEYLVISWEALLPRKLEQLTGSTYLPRGV